MMMTEKIKFNEGYGCCSGFYCVMIIIMIKKMASVDDKCEWNTPELVAINGII